MPTNKWNRHQNQRRQDVMKVTIEEVNLTAIPFPIAQGRDRAQSWGLFSIDLSHGVGGRFPTPVVGEVWWIKKSIGSRWVLDHKVDPDRESSDTDGGGGGGGDSNRSDIPTNVVLAFNVREKKTSLEYEAFVTFDAVTTDENGDPANPEHYVVDWVPCTRSGNIITDEKVRQHIWSPNDTEIDDPLDPAADYYVILPGNVPRPKVWYWKARVRAVSTGGAKGKWSGWTDPVLPLRNSLPEPPAPANVNLKFKWKDTAHQPVFSGVSAWDDVNYWDIPGFDYEDDITEYQVQLMPLDRAGAWISGRDYRKGAAVTDAGIAYVCVKDHTSNGAKQPPNANFWYLAELLTPGDGFNYVRADPNGDGEPWEIRRQNVKDKDKDDTFVSLGTLGESININDTVFDVDETGIVGGPPTTPFVVKSDTNERWLVYTRTLVAGNVYTYEVYREFSATPPATHLVGASLTWLKDPFRYKVDWHNIERPKTIYWRTRVRSKDRFNRLGPYSDWTLPETPWSNIDFNVPPPVDLRAGIEIHSYRTHPEYKLVARFKDAAPDGWNIPGGDLQDDLHHYMVVGEALLPDPDGYIEAEPAEWGADFTYGIGEVVKHNGARYRSLTSGNINHEPPNGSFWVPTTNRAMYRIPDRKIGVVKTPGADVNPADTTMTITLDSGLPNSIQKLINGSGERSFYMRIQSGSGVVGDTANEVVSAEVVSSSGLDRVLTIARAQKGSPDFAHLPGDPVYILTEHIRRKHVGDKDEKELGHKSERYVVNLGRIVQPKRFYWRVRAHSVDTFGHKSPWTEWTHPINPGTDPDLIINAPSYVALKFDRVHRSRWNRWRAIVEFSEVHYTAPDGDREEDVSRYHVQLATTDGDELDLLANSGDATIQVAEKRRAPAPVPFSIMIDDEVMEVTARTQVADNVYTYAVTRAQRGTAAAAHPGGARIYEFPFLHHTVSAKNDDDKNNFNRVAFPKAQKFRHYKARVKAFDRYNRSSLWTAWTADGTPSDNDPPPPPTNVLIDVDNHKIVCNWDFPTDPDDTDPDLRIPSDDAAYFQVQLSTQANFNTIFKKDRYVAATHKTFRVKKPGTGTYYLRVRTVDGSGNKSNWVTDSGSQNGVPTPDPPVITFDTDEQTKKIRANVELVTGVIGIDDDVDGYHFQLQPAEFKRVVEIVGSNETLIDVTNSSNLPNTNFTAYMQDEQLLITNVAGTTWTATRGINGTTNVAHRERARIQYFRAKTKKRNRKTSEEQTVDDPILAIYSNIQKGLWYRARVRAHNTKGRWSNWSLWSDEV